MTQSVKDDKDHCVARKSKDAISEQREEEKSGDAPAIPFQCTLHRSHALNVWEAIEHAQHQKDRIHQPSSHSCLVEEPHFGELVLQGIEDDTWEVTDKTAERLRPPTVPSRRDDCHTNSLS